MLSRISQLGKNLSDELARNMEESPRGRRLEEADVDVNNNDDDAGEVDANTELPADVKAKLRKFARYEEKYPLLLDAYKQLKAGAEQVAKFEKVLQENTPCSSIQEGEQLAEYLNSLTLKNSMLNDEMRKMAKDTSKEDRVKELKAKVTDLEMQLEKTGSNQAVKTTDPQLQSEQVTKDEELQGQMTALTTEVSTLKSALTESEKETRKLQNEIEELSTNVKQTEDALSVAVAERGKFKDKSSELKSELELIRKANESSTAEASNGVLEKLQATKLELDSAKNEISTLKAQAVGNSKILERDMKNTAYTHKQELANLQIIVDTKTEEVGELHLKIKTLEKEFIEHEANIKEQQDTSSTSAQPPTTATIKKNSKKKNKKKSVTNEQPIKSSEQLPSDQMNGSHELEEAHTKLQQSFNELQSSKSSELRAKAEEITSLRDMLKDVGNDLVATRDELKLLREKYGLLEKSHNEAQVSSQDGERLSKEHKLELEVLRNQHERAMTDYEKDKTEHVKLETVWQEEKKTLMDKIETLTSELDSLKESTASATEKDQELETLKKNVEEKDAQMKQLTSTMTDLEKSLTIARDENKKHLVEVNSLTRVKSTLEKDLKAIQSEKSKLAEQNSETEQKLTELVQLRKSEAILKRELSQVQSTLNNREKTIGYFEKQVKEYESVKVNLSEEAARLKGSTRELTVQVTSLTDQLSRMSREKSKMNEKINSLETKYQLALDEKKTLMDQNTILADKFEDLQSVKSTSNEQLESVKRQCQELNVSFKEAQARSEELEDELSECRSLLQERTREAGTIRRLLLDKEVTQDTRVDELSSKLRTALETKERMQSDHAIMLARLQREREETVLKNNELEKVVRDWTRKESLLTAQIQELTQSRDALERQSQQSHTSSNDLSEVVSKMRESLGNSEKKVREYENLNHVLKRLNEELAAKQDRLSKNLKLVTSQLKEQRVRSNQATPVGSPVSSRSNSIVSGMDAIGSLPSPDSDKIAYVRNVLLGFLEHRDQRQQLLPVMSTLLQLNKADEKRFLLALK